MPTNLPSSQKYIDIAAIKENTVILKDGSLRAVIMVSSVNFSLKSEEEQNAIVYSYVGFLNNISYPLQIVIQSRELNIEGYLDGLRAQEKIQTNELLKIHINEYINYIGELVSLGKIMNKRFYVVVPYNPLSDKQKNFLSRLREAFNPTVVIKMKEDRFAKLRAELTRRVDSVIGGLTGMGLSAVELDSQSLIELYYNTYNPLTAANQKLADISQIRVEEN